MSYREPGNVWGGNFAPIVDKLIGSAFLTVLEVARNLGVINQISQNLPVLQAVAAGLPANAALLPVICPTTPGLYWNNGGVVQVS